MKTSKSRFATKIPVIVSSRTLNPSSDAGIPSDRRHFRRKPKNLSFSVRVKKERLISGKRGGPVTPLLRWKIDDVEGSYKASEFGKNSHRKDKVANEVSLSARKLAAGLWHLQLSNVSLRVNDPEHLQKRLHDLLGHEVKSSAKLSNLALERATKWDAKCPKVSDDLYQLQGNSKLLENHQVNAVSIASSLQTELERAYYRIFELETECGYSKKKIDQILHKISEEKVVWRRKEHEKIRAIIDEAKDELSKERKHRQRMEILNSKLVSEISEIKLSTKRFMQDYEKERKARELMEEVCDELAKELGEDKSEVESLKRECTKIREEVDEERRMLQMAEVWREERVQMKLTDAKLILENKYSELNKLQTDIEAFLRSRANSTDVKDIKEAESFKEAVNFVNIHEIKEFSYCPPTSEDIFSIFEELNPALANERENEQCFGHSSSSHSSKIHNGSSEIYGVKDMDLQKFVYENSRRDGDIEEDGSGWETVSHVEDRGFGNSTEESEPSVNGRLSPVSKSGMEWCENRDNSILNKEFREVFSSRKSRKKASTISELWRSHPNNNDKIFEKLSNGIDSPGRCSGEGCFSPPSIMQLSSPRRGNNPHINRGMKGCVEWPKANQKGSLKARLLEARMEKQKFQLRHALKQKI